MRKQDRHARWLWGEMSERRQERDRYRLAWTSARRRATDEANFATEALELKDEEIARLRAALSDTEDAAIAATEALDSEIARGGSFVAELQPTLRKRMTELRRIRAFVAEVQQVRGWCMDAASAQDLMDSHLRPIYDALHELEDAQREGRTYRDRWTRTGHESLADQCPTCDTIESSVPQPAPCTCDDESATVAYWKAELERAHREGNASRLALPERS
ncbi:hypothetical protein [Streptomyces sp. NPDC102264]|uniref:hypothetical protein n=1 Tax=Streptomyces sp. NPDC102264 TaxID=3366149 RepID=UPI003828B79A